MTKIIQEILQSERKPKEKVALLTEKIIVVYNDKQFELLKDDKST